RSRVPFNVTPFGLFLSEPSNPTPTPQAARPNRDASLISSYIRVALHNKSITDTPDPLGGAGERCPAPPRELVHRVAGRGPRACAQEPWARRDPGRAGSWRGLHDRDRVAQCRGCDTQGDERPLMQAAPGRWPPVRPIRPDCEAGGPG